MTWLVALLECTWPGIGAVALIAWDVGMLL